MSKYEIAQKIADLIENSGWNEKTLQVLLFDFVAEYGLEKELLKYLSARAAAEQELEDEAENGDLELVDLSDEDDDAPLF